MYVINIINYFAFTLHVTYIKEIDKLTINLSSYFITSLLLFITFLVIGLNPTILLPLTFITTSNLTVAIN